MKTLPRKAIGALALLAISTSLQADVLVDSFENTPVASNPGAPYASISQSATWASAGLASLAVDFTNSSTFKWFYTAGSSGQGYYGASTYTDWYNHTKLQFDVHREAETFGWNLDLSVAMSGTQGWQQKLSVVNWVWHNAGQSSTETITWDYSAIRDTAPASGTWWQLAFAGRGNNGEGGNFYIDNVQFVSVVPEPTAMSLLGLGLGIVLFGRKRRAIAL